MYLGRRRGVKAAAGRVYDGQGRERERDEARRRDEAGGAFEISNERRAAAREHEMGGRGGGARGGVC